MKLTSFAYMASLIHVCVTKTGAVISEVHKTQSTILPNNKTACLQSAFAAARGDDRGSSHGDLFATVCDPHGGGGGGGGKGGVFIKVRKWWSSLYERHGLLFICIHMCLFVYAYTLVCTHDTGYCAYAYTNYCAYAYTNRHTCDLQSGVHVPV